jgi:hypothetical protein
MVAVYHHPDLGLLSANPKVADEMAGFGSLRKRELVVIYAGKADAPPDAQCKKAAELAVAMFRGEKPVVPADLYKGKFKVAKVSKEEPEEEEPTVVRKPTRGRKPKAAVAKAAAAPTLEQKAEAAHAAGRAAPPAVSTAAAAAGKGPVRMTPMYSVVVSNELFHNGNVEAWKRIIGSYNAKYPDLTVFIYYEGERILDINSLFKWGKVKHGSAIQFAVSGAEIKDVAKLQRYLFSGASKGYEAFLHGPPNTVLKLFG